MSWLQKTSQDDLSWVLSPPGTSPMVGNEQQVSFENNIAVYKDEYGSYRFVYFLNNEPISGLQVVSKDGTNGVIANVYTVPEYKRQGFARQLVNKSREVFDNIEHNKHLTDPGEGFAENT